MNVRIHPSWLELLQSEWDRPYFAEIADKVRRRYAETTVYPPAGQIFAAFDACPADKVKVVILGQDPYHGPGQANGLCFSVNPGVPFPPSLANILKEVSDDTGAPLPPTVTSPDGPSKGCLCSTRRLPWMPILPALTVASVGSA